MRLSSAIAGLATLCLGIATTDTALADETLRSLGNSVPTSALKTEPDGFSRGAAAPGTSSIAAVGDLTASTDGGRANLKFLYLDEDQSIIDNKAWVARLTTYSLVASAPTDKAGPSTNILAAGGLPSDFQFKLGVSHLWATSHFALNDFADRTEDARDACYDVEKNKPDALKACDSNDDILLNKYGNGVAAPRELPSTTYLVGLDFGAGYLKSDYLMTSTGAKASQVHDPWSVKGYFGISPSDAAFVVFASVAYQEKYKDQKSGILCPASTTVPLSCNNAALGPPKAMQSLVPAVEARELIEIPHAPFGLKALGLDLTLAYDTRNDIKSFDLPISVVANDKGDLVGGIDFGWNSDDHKLVAGVFLSSAFSLMSAP